MSIISSNHHKKSSEGFFLNVEARGSSPSYTLTHLAYPGLTIQVWIPFIENEKIPPGYFETVVQIRPHRVGKHFELYSSRLGIEVKSIVNYFQSLRNIGIQLVVPLQELDQQKMGIRDLIARERDFCKRVIEFDGDGPIHEFTQVLEKNAHIDQEITRRKEKIYQCKEIIRRKGELNRFIRQNYCQLINERLGKIDRQIMKLGNVLEKLEVRNPSLICKVHELKQMKLEIEKDFIRNRRKYNSFGVLIKYHHGVLEIAEACRVLKIKHQEIDALDELVRQRIEIDELISDRQEEINQYESHSFLVEAQRACEKNSFEEFVRDNLPLLPVGQYELWKKHLCWFLGKKEVNTVLRYIYLNVMRWIEECEGKERIYIPEQRGIPYSFEYNCHGSLMIEYTYQPPGIPEVQMIRMDLETGYAYQLQIFDGPTGERITDFHPPFEDHPGLIRFLDFYDRNEGRRGIVKVGVYELVDATLFACASKMSDEQKQKVVRNLLHALVILQGEKIVHCGIYPDTIYLRFREKNTVHGFLFNYGSMYSLNTPPENNPFPQRWSEYRPPECVVPFDQLKNPFKIPVYQLGKCFRLMYGENPPLRLQAVIDGMCQEDPDLRWTPQYALCQLFPNPPDDSAQDPIYIFSSNL